MYDNFLFRKSWWNIIKNLPTEQRSEVIDFITQYMFEDIEPQFDEPTAVGMAVQFIIRDINADKERYDTIAEKRREAGRKGAAATNSAKVGKTANAEFAEFAENTKVGKSGKVGSIDKDKNNITSPPPPPPAPAPVPARERLARWVAESELADWIRLKFSQSGFRTEIDIGALLNEFYDNDFTVRERCEQNERTEVLKHFQNWLPKYLNKLKNENNNANNHTSPPKPPNARSGGIISPEDFARSFALGWNSGKREQ